VHIVGAIIKGRLSSSSAESQARRKFAFRVVLYSRFRAVPLLLSTSRSMSSLQCGTVSSE